MSKRRDSGLLVLASLLAGLLLMLVPLPVWAIPLRPYWVALILVFWGLEGSIRITLGAAFGLGIVLDIATASLLGQHALSLVIVLFLINQFRSRLRFFPIWQQSLAVLALLINDRIVLLWILLFKGEQGLTWLFWLAPFVGAFLWPWLFLLLDRVRRLVRRHPV